MAEHNAPFAHIAYQQPDGTTGVLDNCDEIAIHNSEGIVKTENIADRAVTNGKIAEDAVTEVELADGSVTKAKLSPEMQEAWDSQSQTGTHGDYPLFVQHTANTGFVIFSNYRIPRAFHAYNWYEIMSLPSNLMPLTLTNATGATDTGMTVLFSITSGGVVRINPGANELPENASIYGCIPYVLA